MAKFSAADIAAEVQKLYGPKDKTRDIIGTGDSIKTSYTEADVIPLNEGHPLRALIGLPGIPFNKIIQIAGKPDAGKSTLASECMVTAQKSGAQVILFDSEQKWDPSRFKDMGGQPKEILLAKTNEILKGGELVRRYITAIKSKSPEAKILVVWDSVGGSQSRSHAERELDDEKHAQPGQDAKENGMVMKMLVALINKYPNSIAVYLANQTYAKIGFMQHGDAAAGGAKIEYHSSFIAYLRQIKTLTNTVKGAEVKSGIISRATVKKNHLCQGKTSIHKLDFKITAAGTEVTDLDETSADE